MASDEKKENKVTGWGPETLPLKTVDELKSWKKENVPPELIGSDLVKIPHRANWNQRKTLVCHDMKGGYLGDRFSGGERLKDGEVPFSYVHWWYTDIFVYFSHNLVTIPPKGWISAGHRHGTQVLGTFITEWEDGKAICERILSDPQFLEETVDQLVEIAKTYNFDGWLINIENEIKRTHLPRLLRFVRLLTDRCRGVLGTRSCVIWYDSVISSSGRLKWQDELNQLNGPFFDCCDGIFLNYGWKSSSLEQSLETATKLGREKDVFVGVDVFGRGCFGGGGFKTALALDFISKFQLSVAMFAPGWVYENFPGADFPGKNMEFWGCLTAYLTPRPINRLPFQTSFGIGFQTKEKDFCFDLNTEELQPFFLSNKFDKDSEPPMQSFYDGEKSWLSFDFQKSKYLTFLETEVPIDKLKIKCSLVLKGPLDSIVEVMLNTRIPSATDPAETVEKSEAIPKKLNGTSENYLEFIIETEPNGVLVGLSLSAQPTSFDKTIQKFYLRGVCLSQLTSSDL